MAVTYEKIATTTLSSDTANVTFSSISGSYTDLIIIANCASNTATGLSLGIRFNSDSGSNYSVTDLRGNGSAAASSRYLNETAAYLASSISVTTTVGNAVYIGNINNYSNSTTYKTLLARNSIAASGAEASINTWRSTAAITSLTIFYTGYSIKSGSTFTVYGIKAA